MIDRDSLTADQRIFLDGLTAAGFPADDNALKSDLQQIADTVHLPIANPSKFSAFWSFVEAAIAAPVREIVRYLVKTALPGFYVKTATGSNLDLLAWAHDLARKPAVKMTGNLVFSRAAGAVGAVEIPAGTRVRTTALNGITYRMVTLATVIIPADADTVQVKAEAEATGAAYNLGPGYYSLLDSDVPRVGLVTNPADYLIQPGADMEPDEELRLRIRDQFLAAGNWHTDAKYRAMIAEHAGIRPDMIYFDHSAPRGPGSADCYIIFDSGAVPAELLTALNSYITDQGFHGHGDDLQCKAVPVTYYNLGVAIRLDNALSAAAKAAVIAELEQRIRAAFRENRAYDMTQTFPYRVFSFSRLAAELHAALPSLLSIAFTLGDISAMLELPMLSGLTITEITA